MHAHGFRKGIKMSGRMHTKKVHRELEIKEKMWKDLWRGCCNNYACCGLSSICYTERATKQKKHCTDKEYSRD
ncbi:hypothetical protein KDH_20050 [Dictyobacter sp. S3.2.2.5]|uniref:Uncharacterized protein n=1 Tax=Dictyobacter halimunensis TaxID=3026934 RepID=A0ABQ6FQT1_9CHLR|nr:hypothetical protein KDH_20050 [Dictyobacter sp. S3.2.2.5]